MSPDDIDHILFEEILLGDDTAPVRVQVETFLARLRDTEENIAAVYQCARQLAKARWWELKVWQDGDMESLPVDVLVAAGEQPKKSAGLVDEVQFGKEAVADLSGERRLVRVRSADFSGRDFPAHRPWREAMGGLIPLSPPSQLRRLLRSSHAEVQL